MKYLGKRVTEKSRIHWEKSGENLLTFGLESFVFLVVLCVYPGAYLSIIMIFVLKKLKVSWGFQRQEEMQTTEITESEAKYLLQNSRFRGHNNEYIYIYDF
jgi:hypothetical protein